ncbi:MAG: hypothetical protein CENE_03401 [Candidatus Celerinatantimonas neptuna]|nr:MAG: hypothetical protein CENE_03401 [Candidatus Celerinatantimonas neptuna]
MRKFTLVWVVISSLFLVACSSLPESVRLDSHHKNTTYQNAISPAMTGHWVSWQGQIAKVTNEKAETRLDIVYQNLDEQGQPQNDSSPGRFVAVVNQFLDPMVYKPGRTIAVKGIIRHSIGILVGQAHLQAPVIDVKAFYLWPKVKSVNNPPVFCGPFWP